MAKDAQYFRQVVAAVLRWYTEFEDGILPGDQFNPGVLDYRLDVERILKTLSSTDRARLLARHRDGATSQSDQHAEELLEEQLGRLFDDQDLLNLKGYL